MKRNNGCAPGKPGAAANRSRKGAARLKRAANWATARNRRANRSRKGAARLKPPAVAAGDGGKVANRSRKGAARLKPLPAAYFRRRLPLLTAPERGRHD